MNEMLIGLDLATVSGVALAWSPNECVYVASIKGDPIVQLDQIRDMIIEYRRGGENVNVIIEQHVHFRAAKTTRSLIERIGYTRYSLYNDGHNVNVIWPYKSRKAKLHNQYERRGFKKDETDALLLIHEGLSIFEPFSVVEHI